MPSQIVSGYCKCGFPASTRCPKCNVKLCGNCVGKHECATEEAKPAANLSPESLESLLHIARTISGQDQNGAVKSAVRKPYGPRVKK